ncbi:DUF2087 domain-containing protein [Fusibacter ferrireducens]|uniref:DUF2087 domain-containing protein n=1 Tax=Fusibacter ferrireducens TaxID=2785058 RepID=A0ABR9ZU25_9FIRM|nr:DUF2087 domain-containing protein [Fusibacter ferrireducens]MBF4693984.1 DUF2087 domain-containing protein [Fusibacter ferrireducens]
MNINDHYANIENIKKGYRYVVEQDGYECITCGALFESGEIFPIENRFFTAEKAIQYHILHEHGQRLKALLTLDKKLTSITDNQKEILMLMASGIPDKEIAKSLNLSPSTIRHIRFTMREKAKQAKVFLAIYELAFEASSSSPELLPIHAHATMIDDRYQVTTEEANDILKHMFTSLEPLKLKTFSTKEKKKLVILKQIAATLDPQKHYTEKELNTILKAIYPDFVTLRRYLIEYGFMDRSKDGAEYWLKS